MYGFKYSYSIQIIIWLQVFLSNTFARNPTFRWPRQKTECNTDMDWGHSKCKRSRAAIGWDWSRNMGDGNRREFQNTDGRELGLCRRLLYSLQKYDAQVKRTSGLERNLKPSTSTEEMTIRFWQPICKSVDIKEKKKAEEAQTRAIGLLSRVFVNSQGNLGFNHKSSHTKDSKNGTWCRLA